MSLASRRLHAPGAARSRTWSTTSRWPPAHALMQRGLTFGVDRVQVRVRRRARRREVTGRARVVKTLEGVVGVHRADPRAARV